jgi:DNA-directed RNA polymerase beta subunit
MEQIVSELHPELLSLHGLNPFVDTDSSSRGVMYGSHFSQALVLKHATERMFQTGLECQLGRYTFSVKMPEDGRIIKVIDRYPEGVDADTIPLNPETLVIYEDSKTKELGSFSIPYYASYHQSFGFEYALKPAITKLTPGAYIEKGTVFADSPSVRENYGYAYGITMNIAMMTHPAVSEDGVLISRSALQRLKFKVFEKRTIEFGNGAFPLNIYSNNGKYQPFPEIGQMIREDGILMALRPYNNDLMPVEMSVHDCCEVDFIFDKPVFVRGPGGRVVDIKMFHDGSETSSLPNGIMNSVDKYSRALQRYYDTIISTERGIRAERKKRYGETTLALKPELHQLIMDGLAIVPDKTNKFQQRLNLMFRKAPIDVYRIEFVIEYEMTPTIGFKITDGHGNKGVICQIADDDHMPVDSDGNHAEVVMDPGSRSARMNIGGLYETYFGASSRDTAKRVLQMLNIAPMPAFKAAREIAKMDVNLIDHVYRYLLGFYNIISPHQYRRMARCTPEEQIEALSLVVERAITVFFPTNNPVSKPDVYEALEMSYRPTYGKVSYVGNSGKRVTTEDNVRIAPLYMMLLEKIADDGSSVSYGKLQHFGVLSPPNKSEKYAFPYRNSPVRTIGETEGRLFVAYCGRETIAEMIDRSNSTVTHRHTVRNLLEADFPSNLEEVVDRKIVPYGNTKPLQLINHVHICAGFKSRYKRT